MNLTVPQVRDKLVRRVCPLFVEGGARDGLKSPKQVGSAVLFQYGQCSVLLTAKHVCKEGNGVPLRVLTAGDSIDSGIFDSLPYSQKPWNVRSSGFEDADVACIPLNIETAESVGLECEYVDPEEIGSVDDEMPGLESRFVLIGFPNSRNKQAVCDPRTGRARKSLNPTAFTGEFRKRLPARFAAPNGQSPTAHFALQATKKMAMFSGEPDRDAPDFHGMSGGGVWKLHIDPATQLVERCSLVGIFIEKVNKQGIIVLRAVRVEWAKDYTTWWRL